MIYLLDVNALLAFGDEDHVHHITIRRWFSERIMAEANGWATCPLTENGFIRIASNQNYPNPIGDVARTTEVLREVCRYAHHEFWPDDVSLRETLRFDLTRVAGPRQLTDAYLLGLAAGWGGRLATLEQSFPTDAVHHGVNVLERISPIAAP